MYYQTWMKKRYIIEYNCPKTTGLQAFIYRYLCLELRHLFLRSEKYMIICRKCDKF